MLSFVEEIVLFQLDEKGRQAEFPAQVADVVLAGAAMMDLALLKRMDTDLNRLFVDDPRSTGDDILDHALSVLVEAGRNSRISSAIERLNLKTSDAIKGIALHAPRYRDIALQRLVEKGIVRKEADQSFRQYQIIDDSEQREVRARLRLVILADEIPDPRDVVLICLIDACGLLGHVLTIDEIASRRQRIEHLTRLDLIGQAVTKAVSEIRFILQHITPPIGPQ
jgi:golgi phosphoprotein 3